jgi:hypothetical protein
LRQGGTGAGAARCYLSRISPAIVLFVTFFSALPAGLIREDVAHHVRMWCRFDGKSAPKSAEVNVTADLID